MKELLDFDLSKNQYYVEFVLPHVDRRPSTGPIVPIELGISCETENKEKIDKSAYRSGTLLLLTISVKTGLLVNVIDVLKTSLLSSCIYWAIVYY